MLDPGAESDRFGQKSRAFEVFKLIVAQERADVEA